MEKSKGVVNADLTRMVKVLGRMSQDENLKRGRNFYKTRNLRKGLEVGKDRRSIF
jgi:hypothetical protein